MTFTHLKPHEHTLCVAWMKDAISSGRYITGWMCTGINCKHFEATDLVHFVPEGVEYVRGH